MATPPKVSAPNYLNVLAARSMATTRLKFRRSGPGSPSHVWRRSKAAARNSPPGRTYDPDAPKHRPVKPWFFAEGVEQDFAEALAFYREESDALAGRLYDEINRLITDICAAPHVAPHVFTASWLHRSGGTLARPFLTRFFMWINPITSPFAPSRISSADPATGATV